MKQLGTRIFVLLGSGIVSLGLLLFVAILALVVPNVNIESVDIDEESITSRYISESALVLETEDEKNVKDEVDINKQGVIKIIEERKILKVDRIL